MALDLAPDAFDQAFADSQFSFRLSHCPPVPAEANQFGIAPHTDANFLTSLAQTDVPGLQVRMPSGDWLEVPDIPREVGLSIAKAATMAWPLSQSTSISAVVRLVASSNGHGSADVRRGNSVNGWPSTPRQRLWRVTHTSDPIS